MSVVAILLAVLLAVVVFDAWAQGADKGPFDASQIVPYLWVLTLSMAGGMASFYRKVKAGQARWVNINELLGELLTSGLAGLLTFWLCKWGSVNEYLTAVFVGVSGHMGSRALFLMERALERRIDRLFSGNGAFTPPPAPRVSSRVGTPGDER